MTTTTWTPRPPAGRLVTRPVRDSPAWRGYLVSQGYGPGELPQVLGGREPDPGLADAAELRVAELERAAVERGDELEASEVHQARAGAVRVYLEDHPPLRVSTMDPRPVQALGLEAFGERLVPVSAGPGRVQVLEDLQTGRRWWTVGEPGPNAGLAVVAGALYRQVGVAAPAARLVVLEGVRRAVHPEPQAWESMAGPILELHLAELHRELPADVWVAYRGGPRGLRGRSHAMPGSMASTLRLALGSTLGRAGGRPAPTWGVAIPELGELLSSRPWRDTPPAAMEAMAVKVGRVTERQVANAVALGDLDGTTATTLTATLLGRRSLVSQAVLELITGPARSR